MLRTPAPLIGALERLSMAVPSTDMANPLWLFPVFVAMWFGIGGALSYMSGWVQLATRFESSDSVEGQSFRFASGSMGTSTSFPVSYRSCLFITVNSKGFRVAVLFLFRFLTPALFIPWEQVESVTNQRLWFMQHVVVQTKDVRTKLMVPGRAGRCISEAYAQHSSRKAL